ncbi:uncharacterized protein LOC127845267 [Dreissena polymorpha]|uniref:PH domain-containing protein n=1 Tax=Dreissena polymorpha TaxID=45954 RepID=A0A9D4E7W3_DREPO|nr:uncharacterized protein LOC127845267 [Dreissena polymorpha]KAH3774070.1 hypothetical protein DPMN_175441 [Dreissena polymorpha]
MVGRQVILSGDLDVKSPSTFIRGWRPNPWRTQTVELVLQNGVHYLSIYEKNTTKSTKFEDFELKDITEVTMVPSKTHAHAFHIVSGGAPIIVLSGETSMVSRKWIWAIRKALFPRENIAETKKLFLRLVPNADTTRLNLALGIYIVEVSAVAMEMTFTSDVDRACTPVVPFSAVVPTLGQLRLPLTTLGRVTERGSDDNALVIVETNPDISEHGALSLYFATTDGSHESRSKVISVFKNVLFQATNNLHDCITYSNWDFDDQL